VLSKGLSWPVWFIFHPFNTEDGECDSLEEVLRKEMLMRLYKGIYCYKFVVLALFSILLQIMHSDFFTYYKLHLVI
jgi:hypothetical protein